MDNVFVGQPQDPLEDWIAQLFLLGRGTRSFSAGMLFDHALDQIVQSENSFSFPHLYRDSSALIVPKNLVACQRPVSWYRKTMWMGFSSFDASTREVVVL